MLAERSPRRAPVQEDEVDVPESLTEYERGLVRNIPRLQQEQYELKMAIAERRKRFEVFARLYVSHHPEKAGTVDVIETWAMAESRQPAGYKALVQEALNKAKRFLSEDAMILGGMREEAAHWLRLQQRLGRVEETIANVLPFAQRVGRI